MKLKLVVASMSVLGLISFPLFAADNTDTANTTSATATTGNADPAPKHKRHHMKKSHGMVKASCRSDVAPMQPAPVVMTTPMVDNYGVILDSSTQNLGRMIHASPDWFQRIAVVGGMNFDAHWGNLSMGYLGENNRRLSVNDAYLNVTALVNDWTKAFASISYNDATSFATSASSVLHSVKQGIYSAGYSNINFDSIGSSNLNMEQAYITFGNFSCTPFFVQLGKQFQDFGRYQIHPLERTMAQVLSESLQTSAKVGFETQMGFHGSVYSFDNTLTKVGNGHTQPIFGALLGIDQPSDQLGWDLGVGYLSNMTGVNDVAYAINVFESNTPGANIVGTYGRTVGAWSAYGDINSGPFSLSARYASAAQKWDVGTMTTFFQTASGTGARPWAADITAGYAFTAWCKNQDIYLGYQASGNAVNMLLPRNRWILGYDIDVVKNTTLGAELGRDQDYSNGNGGSGRTTGTIGARASVKFG